MAIPQEQLATCCQPEIMPSRLTAVVWEAMLQSSTEVKKPLNQPAQLWTHLEKQTARLREEKIVIKVCYQFWKNINGQIFLTWSYLLEGNLDRDN